MDLKTELAICIVNYNNSELIRNCILSIYQHIHNIDYQIIVCDNNSKDDSISVIKNEFPGVYIIQNDSNEGFSKANNKMIRACKAKFYAFVNTDTLFLSNSFYEMVQFLKKKGDAGVCCCRMLNPNLTNQVVFSKFKKINSVKKTLQLCCSGYFPPFNFNIQNLVPEKEKYPDKDFVEIDSFTGSFFIVKGEVFNEIGVFDENYFLFSEEMDFANRLKACNKKCYLLPRLTFIHLGGESRKKMPAFSKYHFIRSKIILYHKHEENLFWFNKVLFLVFFTWAFYYNLFKNLKYLINSTPNKSSEKINLYIDLIKMLLYVKPYLIPIK